MATAVIQTSSWQEWDGRVVGGKYPLLQCLHHSQESALYLTNLNGATSAIKLLRADAHNADARVASWMLAGQLSHPHLVRVFDTGIWHADEEIDMHFVVMDYCDESLAEVLCMRPITPDEARVMLAPTLDALQYLHAHGTVHGCLSPANILAKGDQLKLSTARLRRSDEKVRSSSVSPYDPPEKASGAFGFSGDIWALGVTLCESLTKQLPTRDRDGSPQLPRDIPAPFDSIVKQCLAVDRDRRITFSSIRKLLDQPVVEIKLKPEPIREPQASPVEGQRARTTPPESAVDRPAQGKRPAQWMERRHLMIGALALLLLIAILIGVRVTQSKPADKATPAVSSIASGTAARDARPPATRRGAAQSGNESGAVLRRVMPDVEAKARNTIQGTVKVKVRVQVDAEGKVTVAGLAAKSPSAYFGRKALDAARQWTFNAPVRNGERQPSNWNIRFEFRRSGTRAAAEMSSSS